MAAEPLGRFRVARTSDLDEAHVAMESTFLPLRMRLRDTSRSPGLDLRLNATQVGGLTVSYVRMGRDLHVTTGEAENYHVNLPVSGGTYSRSGRLEFVRSTPQRAAVFMPELPADIDWPGACAQFCLVFPRRTVQQELEAMLDRPLSEPIVFAPAMDVTSGAGRAWLDVLRLIDRQTAFQHGLLDHPLAAGHLERLLVEGLLLGQRHNYTEALAEPGGSAAPPSVREAIDLMRSRPEQPWTTAALARSVAVSSRSLQDGFARSIGVPPTRYLRDVRLDRVHEELRTADPHTATVSHVAGRWGFLYLSRFAAAYREKFGERPSETLRRRDDGDARGGRPYDPCSARTAPNSALDA
jgi:AraC-like DNA-binding protein